LAAVDRPRALVDRATTPARPPPGWDEDHARRSGAATRHGGGQEIRRRHHIAVPELGERAPLRDACQMEDVRDVGPRGRFAYRSIVEEVHRPSRDAWIRRAGRCAGAREDAHRRAARDQRVHQVRANEPRRSRDEGNHGREGERDDADENSTQGEAPTHRAPSRDASVEPHARS